MNAPRAQSNLRNLEAAPLTQQNIVFRHPHVVEAQMHVTAGGMVMTEHMHRTEDLDARRILWNQDLRLLLAGRGIRAGLDHHDYDLAARVAEAGDVILLAVDDPLVADKLCGG